MIEAEARKIASKYVKPPRTTDFAVMYLPTEGLFAEAMRYPGLAQRCQGQHRVTIAGPTTLTALLSSLQMGFRTLAIQKRSGEVWRVLGEAKTEFEKYGQVWDKLKKQLETAQNTVEEAGRRTRAVTRRLRTVETIEGVAPPLELTGDDEEERDQKQSGVDEISCEHRPQGHQQAESGKGDEQGLNHVAIPLD